MRTFHGLGTGKRARLGSACVAGWFLLAPAIEGARPLADRVTIRRDTYGIPHILAEDEEAAAFALGYAQAEDHGLEIARRYLAARGEAAAVFGVEAREGDFAARRFDNKAEARRALTRVGKPFRRVLDAFAAGVNRYFEPKRAALPAWVPVVDGADILAHTRMGALTGLSSQATVNDLRRKYEPGAAPSGQTTPAAVPESVEGDGSNALALSGKKTRSGKPMLLGNPHLRWASMYWEAHITVPGRLNFYGSTLAGLPTLRAGFNDRLGYVQTNNDPDLEDIYALALERPGSTRYRLRGRAYELEKKDVAVEVKQADGSSSTERRTYWSSAVGPIIHRHDKRAFAIRSVALDAWRYFEGFQELMSARDLRGFVSRLDRNLIPTSNFTYADADGNILYQWNARLPRRLDDGTSYELDLAADDTAHAWKGVHRVRDLPRLLNPAGGYVQNANNSPWWTSVRDHLVRERYPSYVENNPLALRPQRALEMLEAHEKFGLDELRGLKFDTRLLLADRVLPALFEAGRAAKADGDLAAALGVLERWDRRADAESRGALLFQRFWDRYRLRATQPFARPWAATEPGTPNGLSDAREALDALTKAAAETERDYGRLDPRWGDVVRFRVADQDLPGNGADGTFGVYRVMRFDAPRAPGANPATSAPRADANGLPRVAGRPEGIQQPAGFGDAWVLMVHFDRPVQAWSILAYGQSSVPGSPHGRDQLHRFAHGQLRRIWFTEAEIAANLERTYRPE